MKNQIHFCLTPVQAKVYLCTFDGTFDEGEGMSMGQPIEWKNPNNTEEYEFASSLRDYDNDPFAVARKIFDKYPQIKELYLEGALGCTGWVNRDEV